MSSVDPSSSLKRMTSLWSGFKREESMLEQSLWIFESL
jgi:hypothetical protein